MAICRAIGNRQSNWRVPTAEGACHGSEGQSASRQSRPNRQWQWRFALGMDRQPCWRVAPKYASSIIKAQSESAPATLPSWLSPRVHQLASFVPLLPLILPLLYFCFAVTFLISFLFNSLLCYPYDKPILSILLNLACGF